MSKYEELMIILTNALLIVAILNMKNKEIAVHALASGDDYFLVNYAGTGDVHSPSSYPVSIL